MLPYSMRAHAGRARGLAQEFCPQASGGPGCETGSVLKTLKPRFLALLAVMALATLGGCKDYELAWWNWFDPSKPFRRPAQTTINPIFTQVGAADLDTEVLPNAEMPKAEDLQYTEADYVIGPADVINISILDLFQVGMETVIQRQVSHSGYISLPLSPRPVKASGLTQQQLIDAIIGAYQPDILADPTVSVTVALPRQNTFSILGAVDRPSTYSIIRRDLTLLDALAMAGGVTQPVDWVYVIRQRKRGVVGEAPPIKAVEEELPPLPTIPAQAQPQPEPAPLPAPATQPTPPATGPATKPSLEQDLRDLRESIPSLTDQSALLVPAEDDQQRILASAQGIDREAPSGPAAAPPGRSPPEDLKRATVTYKWMYVNGRWVRVPQTPAPLEPVRTQAEPVAPVRPRVAAPAKDEKDPYGWMKGTMSHLSRVIAVDLKKLEAGDPRMNIIICDNDIVQVPTLGFKEFYVIGEVARPGAFDLRGRHVTVKQAIAAAGNLGALSWPNNSMLIRRIGRDQEQFQQLKLQDIMSGKEPDIFLKPDDVIAVGSYWAAPFLAVWRNAFRMTYGFGFIYDRNYSVSDFEVPIFFPAKGIR